MANLDLHTLLTEIQRDIDLLNAADQTPDVQSSLKHLHAAKARLLKLQKNIGTLQVPITL